MNSRVGGLLPGSKPQREMPVHKKILKGINKVYIIIFLIIFTLLSNSVTHDLNRLRD